MISQELQSKFQILEMIAFEKWKKASPKEKKNITKKLGEYEAKMIIKEIEIESLKI